MGPSAVLPRCFACNSNPDLKPTHRCTPRSNHLGGGAAQPTEDCLVFGAYAPLGEQRLVDGGHHPVARISAVVISAVERPHHGLHDPLLIVVEVRRKRM